MAAISNDINAQERTEKTARLLIHELMNPVSSMSLSVETLLLAEDGNEKLNILEQSLDRLVHFIKQYAHAVRKPTIRISDIQVGPLLQACLAESDKHIQLRHASVQIEEQAETANIRGDEELLQEAMFHLLLNALEASGFENGDIRISYGNRDDYTFIRIKDHGSGIEESDLPCILDPLFTTKTGHQGLGLTRANSILCAHQAGLRISTLETGGTLAEVRFSAENGV